MSVRAVRFLRILFDLDHPGGRPVAELARRRGVTRRTIERDIHQLVDSDLSLDWRQGWVELREGSFRRILEEFLPIGHPDGEWDI